MCGLNQRVGIEGFFCIVRSAPNFHMEPQWHFSSKALEDYMQIAVRRRWNTAEVGTKIEAFSIAGCDVISRFCPSLLLVFTKPCLIDLLGNAKQKSDHMKGQIRDMINEKLSYVALLIIYLSSQLIS
jgi:hypothetical protein